MMAPAQRSIDRPEAAAIREERADDRAAIRVLHRRAFGHEYEADLVDRLRADGLVVLSLVATEDAVVVGHILFSDLAVEVDGRSVPAVALAPMAVVPERQRRGIGSELVREGLARVGERGKSAVIVVGHPAFYPRFGFSAALARKLESPFASDAFMALELVPGALRGAAGTVTYPGAFFDVG